MFGSLVVELQDSVVKGKLFQTIENIEVVTVCTEKTTGSTRKCVYYRKNSRQRL